MGELASVSPGVAGAAQQGRRDVAGAEGPTTTGDSASETQAGKWQLTRSLVH
jgi:hypothetical protein